MSIEIGYPQQQGEYGIKAGTGAADTAGGSLSGTGTGVDAMISPQPTDLLSSTSADAVTPESQRQYALHDVADKLPVKGIYARPCVWSDVQYWMDS